MGGHLYGSKRTVYPLSVEKGEIEKECRMDLHMGEKRALSKKKNKTRGRFLRSLISRRFLGSWRVRGYFKCE